MYYKKSAVSYRPGDNDFVIEADPNEVQKAGLEKIRRLLAEWKCTGVQECMNRAVFYLLDYIAVFPPWRTRTTGRPRTVPFFPTLT